MAINDRLESIALHLGNAYAKVASKGGTVPANKNLENLANAIDSITGGSPVVGDVQLNAPSLSLGTSTTTSDPLIITNAYNGNFVNTYDIYDGTTLLTSIGANLTSNTINLRDYISTGGAHTIKVIAKGTSMLDSNPATITYRQSTYMTITNNLVNCTTDNDVTTSTVNASYSAILTADDGYSYVGATVSIIMDGVDVTSSVYDKGVITIASITGDIIINATFAVITQLATPNISLSGDTLTIFAVPNAETYMLCLSGNNWREVNTTSINLATTLVVNGTYSISAKAKADGYLDSNQSSSVSYTQSSASNPDVTLENNTWEVIRLVCEMGQANTYWSVGDTKTDLGTDGNTRTFRIVDMQGLYNKHVVFEQVELENIDYKWNAGYHSSYQDDDGCANNYSISTMRNTYLPTIIEKYSSILASNLTNTTYKVAKNGIIGGNIILDLTDKLFLAAVKEIGVARSSVQPIIEESTLITYQYYAINTADSYRAKYQNGEAKVYWLRSPYSHNPGSTSYACSGWGGYMAYSGNLVTVNYGVAPCFSF